MATIETLVDDMDESEVDVETREFGFNGVLFEIDLGPKNHARLEKALQPFIDVARKKGRATTRRSPATAAPRHNNDAIRTWAKKKNLKVSDRGRIPRDIVDRFEADQAKPAKAAAKKAPAKVAV